MTLDDCFERVNTIDGKEHEIYKNGLPEDTRRGVDHLCGIYQSSSELERQEIRLRVTRKTSFVFLKFGEEMATQAVRHREENRIGAGLVALAVEDCIVDWRDSIFPLALLHHSALKLGADSSNLIRSVAAISGERAKRHLFEAFPARNSVDRQLANFGFAEATTPVEGFVYVRTSNRS